MLDIHFYFWFCMDMGEKKKFEARDIIQSFGITDFIDYIGNRACANNLVRDIKFYGLCNLAYASFRKAVKENPFCLWNGDLLFAVPVLQANTIWPSWPPRFAANSGSKAIIQYKNTYTAGFSP